MIDLHSHSAASDGTFTPTQLIDYAVSKGISVLALTDHDTVAGLEEATAHAKQTNLKFIPGIEINISWPTGEFHLLGLGIISPSNSLITIIQKLHKQRVERTEKMIFLLQNEGFDITKEEITEHFHTDSPGRPHFAELLKEKGIVKTRQQAFDRFFAKGRPFYIPNSGADLEEAVQAIKDSKGIPVQAHPMSMYVSWGKMDECMKLIKDKGVQGLEAYHPGVRVAEGERLENLARELDMFVTAGSDFHGDKVRADRHIGHTTGGKEISDRFWTEELQPQLQIVHNNSLL